ncbi:tetratricopeptide repeat protein [Alloalcanivorax mobilis]|uniref:tetratricopeptide repeat protein n=1 Tax=Alloalcanivorax mobilis TaxID=2019569 RepID=UPI000C790098|nr:tetratricopeptide repeat protein [Alloalcanivorax mobilis]
MKSRPSLIIVALAALAGCAHTPPAPKPATPPPANLPPIRYDGETLGDLLVAEVAAQRQALDVTMAYYGKAASRTHDPEVIGQATRLATFLQDPDQARRLAGLWLEREPDNEDALRLAALAEIELGNGDAAAVHIDRLVKRSGSDALVPLVAEAQSLDEEGNRQLLSALSGLAERYPDEAPLWYARALDLRQQADLEGAMEAVEHALDRQPGHQEAQLLKGQLLFEQGEHKKALRHLSKLVDERPEARRPRVAYIRLLLAARQTEKAEQQLRILAEQNPDDLDLQYSLALIALESGAGDAAEDLLRGLLAQGYRSDEIRLNLGQAAELRDAPDQAIDYYLQVQGSDSLRAQVQAARLMYRQGRSAEAHALMTTLINQNPGSTDVLVISEAEMKTENGDADGALAMLKEALANQPDNADLLYSHGMTAQTMGRFEVMERDLKRVLELQPNDAGALNALGYTWADRGVHLDQAEQMIRQALQQNPDDPAILDSMGWVLYRQGRLDQALRYLARAHALYPDSEVAAHLGEVLWQLGEHDKARLVWKSSLDAEPDAPAVRNTLKRLEVEL